MGCSLIMGNHERAELPSAVMLGQDSSTNLQPTKDIGMRNYKFRLTLEVVMLCVLITGVWILLSLPILFYHLPPSEVIVVLY